MREKLIIVGLCIGALALIGFIYVQMGKIDDCRQRGGYAIDTKNGWVCAKLERL